MPTKKPRFSVALPSELWSAVNKYQHENMMDSQNMAINALVQKGLDAIESGIEIVSCSDLGLSKQAIRIAMLFEDLDDYGKELIRTMVEMEHKRPPIPKDVIYRVNKTELPAKEQPDLESMD